MPDLFHLDIRLLQAEDIAPIAQAFAVLGWNKPAAQYERYLAEQKAGTRVCLVAFVENDFAGYVNVLWQPDYEPFRTAGIPEVADFNVLPSYRRRKIGTRLMAEAEATIAQQSTLAGIGVGLYPDYGAAQQLYVLRGYVPDGRGVTYNTRVLQPMESTVNDDNLVLYFTKQLA